MSSITSLLSSPHGVLAWVMLFVVVYVGAWEVLAVESSTVPGVHGTY